MIPGLLLVLPWAAFFLYAAVRIREPEPLPGLPPARGAGDGAPVSVVVPARNEEREIEACLRSLAAQRHPDFEIVVVDDRSDDATASRARSVPPGNARRIVVVEGEPLPPGWFGKPWACWQGAREARGELLLFTDADTRHGPGLLRRAAAYVEARPGIGGVTVLGRQVLGSFWERVVMPHVLLLLLLRFHRVGESVSRGDCGDAIANGQYILVRREAYDGIDGHRRVAGEVVEDLRLAQELCRTGRPLHVRSAPGALATRMYRSLGELVEGWSKNLSTGARQSVRPALRPFALPVIVAFLVGFWVLPPAALLAGLAGGLPLPVVVWGAGATLVSAAGWGGALPRLDVRRRYGLLHPLGAAVAAGIVIRSWLRGDRIEWKGREYRGGDGAAGSGNTVDG